MIRGVYVGPRKELVGRTALLIEQKSPFGEPSWSAQFVDATHFGEVEGSLAFGWHPFEYDDFDVIPDDIAFDSGIDKDVSFAERLLTWTLTFYGIFLGLVVYAVLRGILLS